MKRVDQITTGLDPSKALQTDFRAPKKTEGPEADAIKLIFGVLAEEYPFFLSKHDDDLTRKIEMWIVGLAPYDNATRQEALTKTMIGTQGVKPTGIGGPTLEEFIGRCRSQHRPELSWKQRLLPAPEAKREVVQTEMDKIREVLGTPTTTNTK